MQLKLEAFICLMIAFTTGCINHKVEEIKKDPCICDPDFSTIDYEPAWSPDGSSIAFVHFDTSIAKWGIYLISPDGTNNRLWHKGRSAQSPSWSPDGQWIAFSEYGQIWKKKFNGDSLTKITSQGNNFFPTWSPDSKWIFYDSNLDSPKGQNFIWNRNLKDTSNSKCIAYTPDKGETRMPSCCRFINSIVHVRYVGVSYPEIFIMDTSGTNAKRLTYDQNEDYFPKFSPDGTKIAFSCKPVNGLSQIFTMNVDGSSIKELTKTQGYTCDWSPDGQKIVYTDSRAINGRLWIMNADGTNPIQLTFPNQF